MTRAKILAAIVAERERQDSLFGGPAHDDRHRPADWVALRAKHHGQAVSDGQPDHAAQDLDALGQSRYRRQLIRLMAVACAAIEAFDRKQALANADPLARVRAICQAYADEAKETVLFITEPSPSPIERATSQGPYGVLISQAEAWELKGAYERLEPAGRART